MAADGSSPRTLIAGGTLVTAERAVPGDLLIVDGLIAESGGNLKSSQNVARTIDATGMLVMPGGVDTHVHLAHPIDSLGITTADGFFAGSRAGACGGVTTFIDFALQRKGESLHAAVERRVAEIRPEAVTDFSVHVIITDVRPETLAEIPELIGEGFPSIKLFMTYGDKRVSDDDMLRVLEVTGPAGGLVFVHCENDAIVSHLRHQFFHDGRTGPHYHALSRPALAEEEAVNRVAAVAKIVGAPVFIGHVTTAGAVDTIRRARADGQPVFGETCPHYLTLTDDVFAEGAGFEAAKFVCSPPMRNASHQAAVWKGLEDGTLTQVTSDHAPFRFEGQKTLGRDDFRDIPNGLPGIETRLPLLYRAGVVEGRLTPSQFVQLVSTGPARLFGLYPHKGSLEDGAHADVVLFDPDKTGRVRAKELHSEVDYSPYEGMELHGQPVLTLSRGEVVWDGRETHGGRGRGRLANRSPLDLELVL
ncbi:MAG: dihydropyrimidinase [Longimicrobiales bacterium]